MSTVKNVKKISTRIVFGAIDTPTGLKALSNGERIHVMSVLGQAIGIKSGKKMMPDGTPHEWQGLKGIFKATNPETGEEFRSSMCYLPDVALVPILTAMAEPGTDALRAVTFAINLFADLATERKSGGSIYEYSFESLLPPDDRDPITAIETALLRFVSPAPATQLEPQMVAVASKSLKQQSRKAR